MMPKVKTKAAFIQHLKMFTSTIQKECLSDIFKDHCIVIEEKEELGKGSISLDIAAYAQSEVFFVHIDHQSSHTIGQFKNHNDGIVLKVDLQAKKIDVFLFELKKTLNLDQLEKAAKQLANAYRFIRYLQLEECFELHYTCYLVYQNELKKTAESLKITKGFEFKLFEAVYENSTTIPLMLPLCPYKRYPFQKIRFGETIRL
jgi:hypothetical protein